MIKDKRDKKREPREGIVKKVNIATLGMNFRCGREIDVYGCGIYPPLPRYLIEKG